MRSAASYQLPGEKQSGEAPPPSAPLAPASQSTDAAFPGRDAVGGAGTSAAERNCGCPPWARRCGHFDGRILILADEEAVTPPPNAHSSQGRYGVMVGTHYRDCFDSRCKHVQLVVETPDSREWWNSLAVAEAAFSGRERAMLEAPR